MTGSTIDLTILSDYEHNLGKADTLEFIELCFKDLHQTTETIFDAWNRKDIEEFRMQAHKMKNIAATLGFQYIYQTLARIEKQAGERLEQSFADMCVCITAIEKNERYLRRHYAAA